MVELSGSIALVTGGAQGIGRCFVEHLLAAGAKVSIGDLANSVGPQTQQELNAKYPGNVIFVPCDVTNPQTFENAVKATIQKLGGLTIIINNAGICDESDRGWAVMLKINIEGLVTGTKLGFKYMSKETGGKGGTVVNIASLTTFVPWDPVPVYSGTKAFVNQFSRSYGQPTHFNPTGVKVVSINPGLTDTAILTKAATCTIDESEKTKENFANFVSKFPIQDVDNMGRGLITVLRKAENGSMWVIENNEPAHELKLEYSRIAS